jgi:hypothetical protein
VCARALGPPVYVRRQIVHNRHVVSGPRTARCVFVEGETDIPHGARAIFSAHGLAPSARENASARDLQVVDATCPLVAKVHAGARNYAAQGYTLVIIGHAEHEEIEGTRGEAPEASVLVESAADVERIEPPQTVDSSTSCRRRSRSTRAAAGIVCLSYEAYGWAAFFLVVGALNLAGGYWELTIARSPSPRSNDRRLCRSVLSPELFESESRQWTTRPRTPLISSEMY